MKPIEIIANDLFDKVRSRFSNLQMGDENGAVTANPADARFFDFDFVIEDNNLGRISVSINETGNLKIFFSQGITEGTEESIQSIWFDFLKEMRFFAKRRLLRFDTRDITKSNLDKSDFQYLAQKKNPGPQETNMAESKMFGSSKTSKRKVGETLLIVRHDGKIDDSIPGSRSRKIKNIFIQNAEGERFKSPFAWLPLGRALQRHVYHGGLPHDEHGKDIIENAAKCLQLASFQKHVRNKTKSMNPDALKISERTNAKLHSLRNHMECLSQQKYYENWKNNFQPKEPAGETVLDDATMESYKDTFTVRGFDDSLQEMFPLIHSIMQEESEVDLEDYVKEESDEDICPECHEHPCECNSGENIKEIAAFESWATAILENVLTPDTTDGLQELLTQDLQLGASEELIQSLQGIGINDNVGAELFASLNQLAKMNPNADSDLIKQTIMSWVEATDPEAAQQLNGNPPEATQPQELDPSQQPAPEAAAPVQQNPGIAPGEPVAEGTISELADPALAAEIRKLSDKVKHLNTLYVNSKRFNDVESLQKIKHLLAVVSAKKAELIKRSEETDDNAFLSKVKGRFPEEDFVEPPENEQPASAKVSPQDIAKSIIGFYDRDKGTWTKGRPGIVAGIVREFGPEAGELAKNFIMKLSQESKVSGPNIDNDMEESYTGHYNDDDFYEVDPEDKVIRHAGGHSEYRLPFGHDHIKQPNGNRLMRGSMAKYLKPKTTDKTNESNSEFNAIVKLAGLKKNNQK